MDDILVFSAFLVEHINNLVSTRIFKKSQKVKLNIQTDKCDYESTYTKILYLNFGKNLKLQLILVILPLAPSYRRLFASQTLNKHETNYATKYSGKDIIHAFKDG